MRRLVVLTALAISVSGVSGTSQAQAHWLHTPGQIDRMKTPQQKINAYEADVEHAQRAITWANHHKSFFTFKKWTHHLRGHKWIINFSSQKIAELRWQTTPPHYSQWMCIHSFEGSWKDSGDPYWGGLQMDRDFMRTYAPGWLLRRGWANSWTILEQMWVAENAYVTRGYYPWPNTARYCHLI